MIIGFYDNHGWKASSILPRPQKTKVRKHRKLGTSLHAAISVAISRKGPWQLSRTPAMQTGMTNDWPKDQGLISAKELWVNIHYPATAR
jgi:hypothetical protein